MALVVAEEKKSRQKTGNTFNESTGYAIILLTHKKAADQVEFSDIS